MLIAIFTDIHGNREALEACLAHARRHPIDRYVFLGDLSGYGADPGFVVDTVKDLVARGAIALLGNHDSAAIGMPERMNDDAMRGDRMDARGSSRRLSIGISAQACRSPQRKRPPLCPCQRRLAAAWDYVLDERAAARSLHGDRRAI